MSGLNTKFAILFVVFLAYFLFSYIFLDPNLVLTTFKPYWLFQNWLWQSFLQNREFLIAAYIFIILASFAAYFSVCGKVYDQKESFLKLGKKQIMLLLSVILMPLLLSYNALSHDVFNYIFNARMVVEYGANPHAQTALDFPEDNWTRFMHNTHTPAPYGYGWTVLSLLPYVFGVGKFLVTWLNFKLFAILSYFLVIFILFRFLQLQKRPIASVLLFALNPLVLIEVVGNSHNDLWMMIPTLLSFLLIYRPIKSGQSSKHAVLSFGLLLISASVKMATILLLPLLVWLKFLQSGFADNKIFSFFGKWEISSNFINRNKFRENLPELASLIMFLPLLSARSQFFHPWYLLWCLVWLPLIKSRLISAILIAFSLSSMLRYLPWISSGFEYSDQIVFNQRLITWGGGIFGSVLVWLKLGHLEEGSNDQ